MKKPPTATKKHAVFTLHGDTRVDEYAWMSSKDRAVMDYVAAENAYADASMRASRPLQRTLYKEIRRRMKENDMSVPVKDGPYLYYSRTKKGKQYAIHCRKPVAGAKREEVYLDENALAKGHKYFNIGTFDVSPDHTLVAYTVDTSGNEKYQLFVRDIATGKTIGKSIDSVSDIEWAEDGVHILYTVEDHPHPPRRVYLHSLETDPSEDVLMYEEKDLQWYVTLDKSRSRKYIFIHSANFDTTEVRVLPAHTVHAKLQLIARRKKNVKYFPEHHDAHFYILTNERAINFKVMRAPTHTPEKKYWMTWLPHELERPITGFVAHETFFVLSRREKGSEEVYILEPGSKRGRRVSLPENEHALSVSSELEYTADFVRISYQSFLTPPTVYDVHVKRGTLTVRKTLRVPGWDRKKYTSERLWVKNGTVRVPITIVRSRKTKLNGEAPLMLDAYGAYGITHDPYFSISRPSLLDRGWIVAFGHPRGGGDMGWHWHKQAKLLTKHRTYLDVIASAKHLIQKRYTCADRLVLVGGSAGGMMVGAILNMAPELFGAAIAYVPAADVLTTSLDESLGGTRLHYDETGDPRIPAHYRYMRKYSPYEAVRATKYPPLLVRANVNDIRTPFWEAAKWVARLRAKKTDSNPVLLKTEIVAGHFGKSGRYEWIKDRAFDFAFLLGQIQKK